MNLNSHSGNFIWIECFFISLWVNCGYGLNFSLLRVILSNVADPSKTKVFQGLPAVTAVKCAECSRPSTRKTKLKENRKMKNKQSKVLFIAQAAMVAAIYVVLTLVGASFSYGEVQVRISEALTILPVFTPAAIPGLFIGCLISNILGGCILPDIIFGSLATLIGAIFTWMLRNKSKYLAPLPPIIANVIVVPFVLRYGYQVPLPIPFMMLTVGIGEVISCGVLGLILHTALSRYKNVIFRAQA